MPDADLSLLKSDTKVVQSLNNLYEAERLIEQSVYALADKVPSELVGKLVTLAGELDQTIQDIVLYTVPDS